LKQKKTQTEEPNCHRRLLVYIITHNLQRIF